MPCTATVISDNGPQFVAKDFKEFIRLCGMTHVKTSPYYPQSNGKNERCYQTIKGECLRIKTPLTLEDAQRIVAGYVAYYNTVRLHSAIGYVTPEDKLEGVIRNLGRTRSQARSRPGQEASGPRGESGLRVNPTVRSLPEPWGGAPMRDGLGGGWAPWPHDPSTDPGAKTEGGRHDAALSFPFGIGTKAANRPYLFRCPAVSLSPDPGFSISR